MEEGRKGEFVSFVLLLLAAPIPDSLSLRFPYSILYYAVNFRIKSFLQKKKIICEKVCRAYTEVRDGHLTLNSISLHGECVVAHEAGEFKLGTVPLASYVSQISPIPAYFRG